VLSEGARIMEICRELCGATYKRWFAHVSRALLVAVIPLCACVTAAWHTVAVATEAPSISAMPDGQWEGVLHWAATAPLRDQERSGDYESSGTLKIRVEACAGYVEIFLAEEGNEESLVHIGLNVLSLPDLHLFYMLQSADPDDPYWVEVRTYTLALREENTADVTWSRAVNNRHSEAGDPRRTFSQVGRGKLTRTGVACRPKREPDAST
jgi:hypothetical protein